MWHIDVVQTWTRGQKYVMNSAVAVDNKIFFLKKHIFFLFILKKMYICRRSVKMQYWLTNCFVIIKKKNVWKNKS